MLAGISDAPPSDIGRHEELRKLTISLFRYRWWLIGCTLLFTVAAGIISFVVTPTYLAETTLVPTQNGSGSGVNRSIFGRLGGLAGLVGISGANKPMVNEAIALLKSRQFTEDFIRDKDLLPVLFADEWDSKSGRWKSGIRRPDLWEGYLLFDHNIRFVDTDRRTGVITLRIEWRDPKEAAQWANALVRRVNEEMRRRALKKSAKTLQYLKAELKRTNIVVVQNALQDLIEANLKREALANVTPDYVFTVVDPAAPPDRWDKLRPRKSIYVMTGFFLGFLVAVLSVIAADGVQTVRRWLRESR
jgi:uncharacterized protein involved in exopolysaccharide biosynthesis